MAQQTKPPPVAHWRDVHRRKNAHLLFAEDLGPVGTKVDVEIVDSGVTKVRGSDGETDMPWLAFRGKDGQPKKKRLGLSRGLCKVMETLSGTSNYFEWRGWITLVVVRSKYNDQKTGERLETDAIRIATERPSGKQASAPQRNPQPASSAPPADEPPPRDEPSGQMSDDEKRDIQRREAEEASRG